MISLELNCITITFFCCVCGQTRHSRTPAGSRSDSVPIDHGELSVCVSSLSVNQSVCSVSVSQ